jgi:hypothetical protein
MWQPPGWRDYTQGHPDGTRYSALGTRPPGDGFQHEPISRCGVRTGSMSVFEPARCRCSNRLDGSGCPFGFSRLALANKTPPGHPDPSSRFGLRASFTITVADKRLQDTPTHRTGSRSPRGFTLTLANKTPPGLRDGTRHSVLGYPGAGFSATYSAHPTVTTTLPFTFRSAISASASAARPSGNVRDTWGLSLPSPNQRPSFFIASAKR